MDTSRLLFLMEQLKSPGDVKPKMDVPIEKVAFRFANQASVEHSEAVGKYQLENMPTCFYINPKTNRIKIRCVFFCI